MVREYIFVAVGMSGVCMAAFIQIIIYFQKINLFNGVILAIGLIFLLIFSTISTIHEIMVMDREKQQALQASESKGRFLANMSHEIRTPIHAVLGMNAMILRESKESQIKEYALDIQNAGQTLLSLINDILDLSKIESGKLEILPVEYDFSSLIHDVVNMIEMKARDKGLALNLSVDRKLPSRLWGDAVRIRQILVNLMTNAVKYTETGSVTLAVKADVQGDSAYVTFQIQDTGIGIREEDIGKLFQEFQRIEEQRNRAIEGTGLGMNITMQLLEKMGSRLQVESVYGEGSGFSFTLEQKVISHEPIGDLEQRIKNQAAAYSYQVMFTAPEARLLLVDDNAVNRRVFAQLLKETQIQIDEAAGGKECLELVQKKAYDLIFLDHMMPDLDGIAVLHKMREWQDYPCHSTPVIALTANAVTGAREMYLKEGFQNFLSKPVNQFCQTMEAEADKLGHFLELLGKSKEPDSEVLSQFRIKVHSMKNSAAMIGAVSLAGVARMLEYAARDGKMEVIDNITPVFLQEWGNMKAVLKPVTEEKPDDKKEEADYELTKELLRLLRSAIEEMDVDTADEIIKQLKRFAYPEIIMTEVMENLCLAVTNLDEEQTAVWADKFEQELEEVV